MVMLAITALFSCEPAQASVRFRGISGSYAASDGQLASGQSLANWTIELWFNPTKTDGCGLFSSMPEVPWTGIQIGGGDGVFGCLVILNNPNAYYSASSTQVFTTHEWQLLTIVCENHTMSAYRNGILVGSSPLPGATSFAAKHQGYNLGAFDFGFRDLATLPDDGFFEGYMADFRVWDRALSDSERVAHVTKQPSVDAQGLRNWIPFDETSGSQFHDTVAGLTGTFYNIDLSSDSPSFGPPTPHRATATAQVVNGFLVDATITDPGYGYTNNPLPVVKIDDSTGTKATAHAVVTNGIVLSIVIDDPGMGYSTNAVIRIALPLPSDNSFITNGLVAYYPFNGNANDESGNKNNGNPLMAQLSTDRFDNSKCAFLFNGTNAYIDIPSSTSLDMGDAITACAWIKTTKVYPQSQYGTPQMGILGKGVDVEGALDWVLTVYGDILRPHLMLGSWTYYDSTAVVRTNGWQHVAFTYNRRAINIFSDGLLISTAPASGQIRTSSGSLRIGAVSPVNGLSVGGSKDYYSGKIDDVRIYNRALSDAEVKALYDYESTPPASVSQLWQMNRSSTEAGSVVIDDAAGQVFVQTGNPGRFSCLDLSTGNILWETAVSGGNRSAPTVVSGNRVVFGSDALPNGWVYAHDTRNGAKLWEINLGGAPSAASFNGLNGTFFGTVGNHLGGANQYARITLEGALAWEVGAPVQSRTCPVILRNGTLVYGGGSFNSQITAVQASNGSKLWSFDTGAEAVTEPSLGLDGRILATSRSGRVISIAGATGVKQWEAVVGTEPGTPIADASGHIFVGSRGGMVSAFSALNGSLIWATSHGETSDNSILTLDDQGTIWCGGAQSLIGIRSSDGTVIYRQAVAGGVVSAMIAKGGVVVARTGKGAAAFRVVGVTGLATDAPWPTWRHDSAGTSYEGFPIPSGKNPIISIQPLAQTIVEGQATRLSVVASGTSPLTYQWFKDGAAIAGATLAELTLSNVQVSAAGSYTVQITNGGGTTTSTPALLTVIVPPRITTQPVPQSIIQGQPVSFSGTASGTAPLIYQWLKGGSIIAGASQPVLSIASVSAADAGSYQLRVSNAAGTVTSAEAVLTVIVPPTIATAPTSQKVIAGQTARLTVAANGSAPLSYQWLKDGTAIAGATSAELAIANAQPANAGNYQVQISNAAGSVSSGTVTLTVIVPPTITAAPATQVVIAGQTARFTVAAAGSSPLTYEWFKDGVRVPGASLPEIILANVQPANAGSYTVHVTNEGGTVNSSPAVLTVLVPPTITTAPISQTVIAGQTAKLTVAANGSDPLSYQWMKDGFAIASATQSELIIANAQTANAGGYQVTISNAAGSIRSLVANLTVAFPPSIISQPEESTVFQGQPVAFSVTVAGTQPISLQWLKNGSPIAGATSTTLTIASALFTDAGNYSVDVTSPYGAVRSLAARLTVKVRPNETLFDLTPGGGIVLKNPFQSTFPPDSFVTLTAQPADGWQFLDWKDSTQGTNPTARVQMTYSREVRARFGTDILPTPAGNGTISVSPQSPLYPYGSTVQLVAEPGVGAYFIGWSGSVESLENPLNLVVKDAHPVLVAAFDQLPAGQASFIARADGCGRIVEVPRNNVFDLGQSVTNTAIPDDGQEFLGWSGDATGTQNPLVITLDKSKTITAQFTKRPRLELQSLEVEGFLLSLTGEFTGSFPLLRSTDLQAWDSSVTLKNSYGESQLIIPPGAGDHSFYRIGTPPVPKKQATAVCSVVNGFVVAVVITDPGSGYTVAPAVEIVGSGTGATAIATILNGMVDKITVRSAGVDYSTAPEVRVGAP